jgi:predicted transposase YbfD/YdcC
METAARFKACQIRTAIKVRRETEQLKSAKKSVAASYYLSNEVGKYEELVRAICGHWQVEVNNQLRDVTLKEDQQRTKKSGYASDG